MSKQNDAPPLPFDHCQIQFQPQETEAAFRSTASDYLFGQFVAPATCPNGDYVAGRSGQVRFAYANEDGELVPDEKESRHQNVLRIFLNSLQNDSWELLPPEVGDAWYARRLRRPTKVIVKKKLRPREKIGIPLTIIAAILLTSYVVWALSRPFPNGVRQYEEMALIERDVDPYRVGKVLVVNHLPVSILDPLSGRPDTLHWLLPDSIRAEKYDEVETVIWMGCRTRVRKEWTVTNCEVTVIDYQTRQMVAVEKFLGDRYQTPVPLEARPRIRDEAGIVEYIVSLPEQKK